MSHPTVDMALLKACLRRDRRAQNEFHRTHFPYMMSVALGFTKNRDQAAEWVNMAFVRVFMNLKSFDVSRHLGTWMGSVLRHVIIDDLRKSARQLKVLDDPELLNHHAGPRVNPDDFPELVACVEQELGQLSKVTRQVFMMYVIEGYNHREIAHKLSIAEGTSRWHFSEAKKTLREFLNSNWMRHGF
jgi:RNA polymerase sigma-70 factor (ECF subfamily)